MFIVDAGRDETPAAAADVTFSSLNVEEEPSARSSVPIGAVKFTSSPRPHRTTANLRARPCLLLEELSLRSIALSWLSMSIECFKNGHG
jgi:hypothetical protein